MPEAPGSLKWQSNDLSKSVEELLKYVENQANKAMDWYWRKKKWKAWVSIVIQFSAVVLTALGGILPVAKTIIFGTDQKVDTGLWASLCVGLAAALIGIDRAFGYSSG